MVCVAWLVSAPTAMVTGVFGAALARSSVTPGRAVVTVLVELSIGTPSTVSCASTPAVPWVKFSAELVTVRLPAAPEVLLTRTSRDPCASVTTLAVTP